MAACGLITAALIVLTALPARAATVTWVIPGPSTNDWSNTNNWSTTNVPAAGDEVIINYTNVGVLLTNAVGYFSSVLLSNKCTLIFSNWDTKLSATNVSILTNSTVTHGANSDTTAPWVPEARVWLQCSNLTVAAGGSINADSKGYQGRFAGGGYGPGGGKFHYIAGGGYGGAGAVATTNTGQIYGSASAPEDPGSAGGGHPSSGVGGHGGGAIKIEADGDVTVNGTISAQGGNGTDAYRGGGSGGGIYIQCRTFQGSGSVSVRGGGTTAGGSEGGGGGGRIAVIYNSTAQGGLGSQPTVTFDAKWGFGQYSATYYGDLGTIYLPDALLLTETLALFYGQIVGFTNWSPNNLTITNTEIRLADEGLNLNVTNDITIAGSSAKLQFGSAFYTIYGYTSPGTNGFVVSAGGDFVVTNGAQCTLFAGITTTGSTNWGASLTVTGQIRIASNSTLYSYSHHTNGSGTAISAGSVVVASNATLSASGRGYGPLGYTAGSGVGPGAAATTGGGGYGGAGGNGQQGVGGPTYGSLNAPDKAGSSGGIWTTAGNHNAGAGGGILRIVAADLVVIDGTVSADGASSYGSTSYDGGASGGAVFIQCRTLRGNGTLSASGGNAWNYGGGGGGGRIAVWRMYSSGTITTSVSAGTGYNNGADGADGTVVWVLLPAPGTVFTIH